MNITIIDPKSGQVHPLSANDETNEAIFGARWHHGVLDLIDTPEDKATADHYELQWGSEVGFQAFAQNNPKAMQATPGKQMGWPLFFHEVRELAREREVRVYDAACGFGGLLDEFFADPVPEGLVYVGADVHGSLASIRIPPGVRSGQITLLRWDIGERLPVLEPFDVVVCRASIHHTKEPHRTFDNLVSVLKPAGRIAISAYARKGNLREAVDNGVRAAISPLPPKEAMRVGRELALFGRALQETGAVVGIAEDMPWLGIKAGEYPLQSLIYDHLLKCWWNDAFGESYSTVVNYDWYHPTYAYRYTLDQLKTWFDKNKIRLTCTQSTPFQHFLEGVRDV